MTEPGTTLDPRFSDPGATAAGWAQTRQVLEEAQLSWICTVRADGRPHLTPLVGAKVLAFAKGRFGQTRYRFS